MEKNLNSTPKTSEDDAKKSQEQNALTLNEKRNERKAYKAVADGLKLVIDTATLECNLCTSPKGILKVNYDTPTIQNKKTATLKEKSSSSLTFTGNCTKSPQSASPCSAVMKLGEWKDYGTSKSQDQYVLLLKSTIPCLYGGIDVKITDCGQINEPNKVEINDAPAPENSFSKCYCDRLFTVEEVKNIIIQLRKKDIILKDGKEQKSTILDDEDKPILDKNGNKQYEVYAAYHSMKSNRSKLFFSGDEKINSDETNFESFTKALNNTINKYSINTCIRKIHFLAQVAHETGLFSITYEKGKDSDMSHYSGGEQFRGRGLIQVTHDYDYINYYNYINKTSYTAKDTNFYNKNLIPFRKRLSTEIGYACDSGGWEWAVQKKASYDKASNKVKFKEILGKTLNEIADYGDTYRYRISVLINGGTNGEKERKLYYNLLKEIFEYNSCTNKKNEKKSTFKDIKD